MIPALVFATLAAGACHLIDLAGKIVTDARLDSVDELAQLLRKQ